MTLGAIALDELAMNTEMMFTCADGYETKDGGKEYNVQCIASQDGKTSEWSTVESSCVKAGTGEIKENLIQS